MREGPFMSLAPLREGCEQHTGLGRVSRLRGRVDTVSFHVDLSPNLLFLDNTLFNF